MSKAIQTTDTAKWKGQVSYESKLHNDQNNLHRGEYCCTQTYLEGMSFDAIAEMKGNGGADDKDKNTGEKVYHCEMGAQKLVQPSTATPHFTHYSQMQRLIITLLKVLAQPLGGKVCRPAHGFLEMQQARPGEEGHARHDLQHIEAAKSVRGGRIQTIDDGDAGGDGRVVQTDQCRVQGRLDGARCGAGGRLGGCRNAARRTRRWRCC